jgi:hypothetical protein
MIQVVRLRLLAALVSFPTYPEMPFPPIAHRLWLESQCFINMLALFRLVDLLLLVNTELTWTHVYEEEKTAAFHVLA